MPSFAQRSLNEYRTISEDPQLRPAREGDAAFAWRVTETCMKVYAEQTWGYWDGEANFDPEHDQIITRLGWDIGVMRIERLPDHWFLSKLYLLPALQGEGVGSRSLENLIIDARTARLPPRLHMECG